MIHGYHVILPVYGFWLPNDPRGSWSEMVRKWELVRFGEATKSLVRKTMDQLSDQERAQWAAARAALQYPPVSLTGEQAKVIALGFKNRVLASNYTIWACSILPEHTHMVIARHTFEVEKIAIQLKGAATRELIVAGCHPLAEFTRPGKRPPRMWVEHGWKVYLDSEEAIENAIRYVEQNPGRENLPVQQWSFVMPFAGIERGGWITYH